MRLLEGKKDFSLQGLIDAAYDSYQPTFAVLIPPLIKDYDALPASSPLKSNLADQVQLLRGWDYRWSAESVPRRKDLLGQDLWRRHHRTPTTKSPGGSTSPRRRRQRLESLAAASDKLTQDFGT